MPFSLFAASLRCPVCGNVSAESSAIWIQTTLPRDDGSETYYPGSAIDIVPPEAAGYLRVNPWHPGEPLHLLEAWGCPACGAEPNWAEVVIDQDKLQSITAVPLDAETLDRVHYITGELELYFEQITGERLFTGGAPRLDFLELLREKVAAGGPQ